MSWIDMETKSWRHRIIWAFCIICLSFTCLSAVPSFAFADDSITGTRDLEVEQHAQISNVDTSCLPESGTSASVNSAAEPEVQECSGGDFSDTQGDNIDCDVNIDINNTPASDANASVSDQSDIPESESVNDTVVLDSQTESKQNEELSANEAVSDNDCNEEAALVPSGGILNSSSDQVDSQGPTAVSPAVAASFENVSIDFEDVSGASREVLSEGQGKNLVVVLGRYSGCYNSTAAFQNIKAIASRDSYSNVYFYGLNADSSYNSETLALTQLTNCFYGNTNSFSPLWTLLSVAGFETNSVTLPGIFYINKQGMLVYYTTAAQSASSITRVIEESFGIPYDDGSANLTIKGTIDQKAVRDLLDKVNSARREAGVGELGWNSSLEQAVIQRAIELGVYFSHTRPNGSSCFTAMDEVGHSYGYCAENIAIGYNSAVEVNAGWTNSSGHYANMINSNMKSFAAACFIVNGMKCWVEMFSNAVPSGMTDDALVKTDSFAVCFTPENVDLSIEGSGSVTAKYGDKVQYSIANINQGWSYCISPVQSDEFVWVSSNSAILKSLGKGSFQIMGAGTVNLSLTDQKKSVVYATKTITVFFDIANMTISIPNQTYTGSALKPAVTVKNGTITLKSGTDYTAKYSNNTNAGTATVTITGIGDYTGELTKTFKINPASIAKAKVTTKDQTYTGAALKPAVTVKIGDVSLKSGTDYSVAYSSNTNAGTATVTITGKGNYTGTATTTFTIARKSLTGSMVGSLASQTYTGSALKPAPSVKNGATTLKNGTDYTLSYSSNTKVGTAKVTITGKGNYTGTVTKTFKINPASVAKAKVTTKAQTYTGKSLTPNPTVKVGNKTLKKNTDYTLTYKNNKKTGKATVTIKGKGNYTGSISKTFNIKPAKVTGVKATSSKKGKVTVKWSNSKGKAANVTGYKIVVKSGSKTIKTQYVSGKSSKSKTITLANKYKGKKVKVYVYAYKTIDKTKVCSAVSSASTVKVKK